MKEVSLDNGFNSIGKIFLPIKITRSLTKFQHQNEFYLVKILFLCQSKFIYISMTSSRGVQEHGRIKTMTCILLSL